MLHGFHNKLYIIYVKLKNSTMALRKFMHPRNKYKQGVDFKQLAILYPDFCHHTVTDLSGKLRYNFKNKESLRVLARTLFKHDFHLDVDIPDEKLVPAMPLRLNYVLWIEDLLNFAKLKELGEIHGIDIGTGAVCVYPLLCSKLYGWKMTGTEISETSILSANSNVEKNRLDHLIRVSRVKDEKSTLTEVVKESELYTFTMCNPPFFNSTEEFAKKEKRLPPRNAATGNTSELLVEGGEKSFITRLIDESLMLRERVTIYTTMLGQKSSCSFFRAELKRKNIHNATWTEFCQGHTKRWGLAWTFLPKETLDLKNAPVIRTRQDSQTIKQPKDRPSEMVFPFGDKFRNVDELIGILKTWILELKIEMKELEITSEFEGWTCRLRAQEDSWSHARRKRRMAQRQEQSAKKSRLESLDQSSIDDPESNEDFQVQSSASAGITNPHLECILMVGEVESKDTSQDREAEKLVKISVLYENGDGGKNALETFRQWLINKLNIRDYLTIKNGSNDPRKKRRKDKKIKSGAVN